MYRHPPMSTRPDTACPYPTLFRPGRQHVDRQAEVAERRDIGGVLGGEASEIGIGAVLGAQAPDRRWGGRAAKRVGEGEGAAHHPRSEEHTSELQSLMRISYAVFCLKKKHNKTCKEHTEHQ